MLMPYGAGDAKVSCMRHELEHVVRASWLVQNDVGHLYLSEGKSSQVKSTMSIPVRKPVVSRLPTVFLNRWTGTQVQQ
jgi:hypothetical protein